MVRRADRSPVGLPGVAVVASVVANGLLVGASLDQSIKQLPARHRLGVAAFAAYSQAADLHNGVAFYAILGLGAAALTAGFDLFERLTAVRTGLQAATLAAMVGALARLLAPPTRHRTGVRPTRRPTTDRDMPAACQPTRPASGGVRWAS